MLHTQKKTPPRMKVKRLLPARKASPQGKAAATLGYAVGIRIVHPMFGDGTVMAVDLDKLTIRFRGGRVRQIVDAFVKRRQ
jgi:hypothetical protein